MEILYLKNNSVSKIRFNLFKKLENYSLKNIYEILKETLTPSTL